MGGGVNSVMKTKVVHCKKEHYDIYIGRPSKWGNPFRIGQYYHGKILSRQDSIQAYRNWLLFSKKGHDLLKDIHELQGKILGCWCKPLACHGDILAEIANNKGRK
jgi:hypothetical protein